MTSPSLDLQKLLHATLEADATLTALIGGGRIFDALPERSPFPYVVIGPAQWRALGADQDGTSEHLVDLSVFDRSETRSNVLAAAEAIRAALDETTLTLTTHHLVSLRVLRVDVSRNVKRRIYTAAIRLRAVIDFQSE